MFEPVPSEWMRKYLKEQGREFSDKEKAALIWNAPDHTLSEKLEVLAELAGGSSDDELILILNLRIDIFASISRLSPRQSS